ncbi:MAG: hypothetical protein WC876_04510 [Candidatus Thermoplasmatota archaeon]
MPLDGVARLVLVLGALVVVLVVNVLQFAGKGQLGITLAGCGVAWILAKLAAWSP